MCLAVPMRLVEINDLEGQAEVSGVKRRVMLDLVPDARIGDYVLIHAGYAIQTLDEQAALETLELFSEMFAEEL